MNDVNVERHSGNAHVFKTIFALNTLVWVAKSETFTNSKDM